MAKIQVWPKYTLALPPNFKWGHGPLATSSTNKVPQFLNQILDIFSVLQSYMCPG